ncbi:MAG TPA: hypothetical protein PLE35_03380, partial [Lentisphaeria bacterium]|nr:hypothetical protein [Lentisphaeria bacterium]
MVTWRGVLWSVAIGVLLLGGSACRHCPLQSAAAVQPPALLALPAAKADVVQYYEQGQYEREVAKLMAEAMALLP